MAQWLRRHNRVYDRLILGPFFRYNVIPSSILLLSTTVSVDKCVIGSRTAVINNKITKKSVVNKYLSLEEKKK